MKICTIFSPRSRKGAPQRGGKLSDAVLQPSTTGKNGRPTLPAKATQGAQTSTLTKPQLGIPQTPAEMLSAKAKQRLRILSPHPVTRYLPSSSGGQWSPHRSLSSFQPCSHEEFLPPPPCRVRPSPPPRRLRLPHHRDRGDPGGSQTAPTSGGTWTSPSPGSNKMTVTLPLSEQCQRKSAKQRSKEDPRSQEIPRVPSKTTGNAKGQENRKANERRQSVKARPRMKEDEKTKYGAGGKICKPHL